MRDDGFDLNLIQIEDPMDFLTADEKEAFLRASEQARSADRPYAAAGYEESEEEDGEDDDYDDYDDDDYDDDDDEEDGAYYEGYGGEGLREAAHPAGGYRQERRTAKAAQPAARQRQEAVRRYRETAEEEEVEETVLDWVISVAMKASLAGILIIALIIAVMIVVRPAVRGALGLNRWMGSSAESSTGETELPGSASSDVTLLAQSQGAGAESTAPAAPQQTPAGNDARTTTQLNLRNAPNTDTSEVIVTVQEGTRLTVLEEDDEWSKVLYEGQELFCASRYLEFIR